MPEALTNDSSNRAKLILNASGGSSGVSWSWTVTDGNPTFGGYGYSGAYLSVTVAGNVVENVSNQSYDFGGSTGSNTIVTNAYFPKTGRSNSGFIGLSPGDHLVSGTFYTTGTVGTATVSFYVNVPYPAPVWTDLTITNSIVRGTGYYSEIAATNYVSSYGVVAGSFPPGLSFNTSNGVISGTPTTDGYYAFTVRAYASGGTIDAGLAISVIPPAPVFSDGSVNSSARVGIAYSDGVSASDATGYTVNSGSLPNGLSLNSSNGAIIGTPSAPGTFNFVIRASNSTGGTNTGTLTITVISAARVWNGSAFVSGLANVWNGSAFVSGTIRVWNGSAWVNTN